MRNTSALERKTLRLAEEVRQLYPERKHLELFRLDLHSRAERARLVPFKRAFETKMHAKQWLDLNDYTPHDRDEARLWLLLEDAIGRGDERDARAWRHWLQFAPELVIEQFLALPESSIPAQAHMRDGHVVYNARKCFREDQQRFSRWYEALEENNLTAAPLAREWLAAFSLEHADGRSNQTPEWTME